MSARDGPYVGYSLDQEEYFPVGTPTQRSSLTGGPAGSDAPQLEIRPAPGTPAEASGVAGQDPGPPPHWAIRAPGGSEEMGGGGAWAGAKLLKSVL